MIFSFCFRVPLSVVSLLQHRLHLLYLGPKRVAFPAGVVQLPQERVPSNPQLEHLLDQLECGVRRVLKQLIQLPNDVV